MKQRCKLILGIKSYPERKITVKPQATRNWGLVEKFVDNDDFMFTEISLRPENTRKAEILCDRWDTFIHDLHFGGMRLQDLTDYNEDLKALFNVNCDGSFRDLQYNKYPIDCCDKFLEVMSDEDLPSDLDSFLVFETDLDRLCGCIGRWNLFIVSNGVTDDKSD